MLFILSVRNAFTTNDPQKKLDVTNVYSSAKANGFLAYNTCMQRMKCPVSRKEKCSEECQAGNSEEEIEEYEELTRNEPRDSKKKKKPVDNDKQAMKTDL